MKLALVSDNSTAQGTEAVDYLLKSIGVPKSDISIGYIASSPDPDKFFFGQTVAFYRSLGIADVVYLELEDGYSQVLATEVLSKSVIHLSGGNTYRFLSWLKHRGLDVQLRALALNGKPMVGVSAGAMLLTPSIASAALCGDINEVDLSDDSALGLIPSLFCAHSTKDVAEQELALQISAKTGNKLVMCSDSDAVYVDDKQIKAFGKPVWIASETDI
ncbi:Type 1 glutamine amidotransferase-like domain-containing protein [Shewanella sp. AS1]|uniref:Type 1 glutamine amidotransferase-like domain-containing protein n=1 Tax=Shewanella sp. AS1 TaxID=2907626 RepID=UPI001F1DAC65|nr:Type 1 glutamine amidotransferase-like domain-containing protein [Shewanella sp. AS1]MCE9679815.1 Type 1 glutamine amidotransferase-like domain-containing protein [Shewanella sp. AS1]